MFGVEEKANTPEARRKRRRSKPSMSEEELETKRMTHIAIERNRRRQMNDYLTVLRSLMPPSYSQRGDQASIVGGAINFVKELEHLLQLSTFPQLYTRRSSSNSCITANVAVERRSDIEVTMMEGHASIKILAKKNPKQLLKLVAGFQSLCLNILHLSITTVDQSVLYSFSVKVEDECQLSSVNEIATAIQEMIGRIQQESTSLA
ncbi:transcription factor bHLH96-like [Salvia hispanica]|uniref:transcription factor bHLH96-like n=1 Tax=Salvia hispanica TaxID=49212 RepID=UPI0020090A78|nr:transcription factor bHLH96-like [Salvia hispanica]